MAESIDGSISQEDIDALLGDVGGAGEDGEAKEKTEEKGDSPDLGIKRDDKQSQEKTSGKRPKPSAASKVDSSESIENMSLLLDVKMDLSVEIGRSKMRIDEILSLGSGEIVELDKLNGELIDITVNNRLIAKGEIVAIDGNFGVKIAKIINIAERLKFEL